MIYHAGLIMGRMAQLFPRFTNALAVWVITLTIVTLIAFSIFAFLYSRSDWITEAANFVTTQPVPFSHKHHVNGLGLDCRYCHTSVETGSFAGMPPSGTCITCHAQIWKDSPMLEPVRQSVLTNTPLRWTRVNNVAQFVYFAHDIHIAKGVGCFVCHGRIDLMPLTAKTVSMQMVWCLDCHRDPGPRLRPRNEVFNMEWQPPGNAREKGELLIREYHINRSILTNCSTCHR